MLPHFLLIQTLKNLSLVQGKIFVIFPTLDSIMNIDKLHQNMPVDCYFILCLRVISTLNTALNEIEEESDWKIIAYIGSWIQFNLSCLSC